MAWPPPACPSRGAEGAPPWLPGPALSPLSFCFPIICAEPVVSCDSLGTRGAAGLPPGAAELGTRSRMAVIPGATYREPAFIRPPRQARRASHVHLQADGPMWSLWRSGLLVLPFRGLVLAAGLSLGERAMQPHFLSEAREEEPPAEVTWRLPPSRCQTPPPTPGLFWWRAENPVQANKEQVLLSGKRLPPPALPGQGKERPRMWGTHPARLRRALEPSQPTAHHPPPPQGRRTQGCGGQRPSHGEAPPIGLCFCRRFRPKGGREGLGWASGLRAEWAQQGTALGTCQNGPFPGALPPGHGDPSPGGHHAL